MTKYILMLTDDRGTIEVPFEAEPDNLDKAIKWINSHISHFPTSAGIGVMEAPIEAEEAKP